MSAARGRPPEYAEAFRAEHYRPVINRRLGMPEFRPYEWRRGMDQDAAVMARVRAAREAAREKIRGELRRGAWWIPRGFTEADLDALPELADDPPRSWRPW